MESKFKMVVDITNRSNSYGSSRIYRFKNDGGNTVFKTEQIPFPECCGIAILKNYCVSQTLSVKEFVSCMDDLIEDLKKNDLFSRIILYTSVGSTAATFFCEHPKAIITDKFKNRRSGNILIGAEFDLLKKEDLVNKEEQEAPHVIRTISDPEVGWYSPSGLSWNTITDASQMRDVPNRSIVEDSFDISDL